MTRGFVYCGTGQSYAKEAVRSASFLRTVMPGVPITFFSDGSPVPDNVFDEIVPLAYPTHSFYDKIQAIQQSPYSETLFVDSDTLVVADVSDIFEALERFDVMACHAPSRRGRMRDGTVWPELPDCVPQMNTGVIALRRNRAVEIMLESWSRLYKELTHTIPGDQLAFAKAVWESDVSLYILPPEYNFRLPFPALKGARADVKIIHSHAVLDFPDPQIEQLVSALNRYEEYAVWLPEFARIQYQNGHVMKFN